MPQPRAEAPLKAVETLFRAGAIGSETDGRLLARFLDGDAPADGFAALVDRHAPMILGVCRRILDDPNDADDAAQATFLVLARRARAIRNHDSLASWLFGVALRVAKRAKSDATRRREHERRKAEMTAIRAETQGDPATIGVIDEEIARLPERLRGPIVVCYLEGLTQEQAAGRLNLPLRTIQRRLAQGRERLRARLARRGVAVPGDGGRSPMALPPLVVVALSASWLAAAGRVGSVGGSASTVGRALAESTLWEMTMTTAKTVAASVFLVSLVALGIAVPILGQRPQEPAPAAPVPRPDDPPPTIDLTVRDARTLRPIAGVALRINPNAEAVTDAEGRATLPLTGDYAQILAITARKEGYAPVKLLWGSRIGPVVRPVPGSHALDMEPSTTIGGKVVDESGKPVAGAKVYLQIRAPDPARGPDWFDTEDDPVVTRDDGTWSFDGMPIAPAEVKARVAHPGYADDGDFNTVSGPDAQAFRRREAVLTLARGFTVAGEVVDLEGEPIAGARIARGSNGFRHADWPVVATDPRGKFRFTQGERGSLDLTVLAPGHAPDSKLVQVGPDLEPITFRLAPERTLRGRVLDRDGRAVAGARVVLDKWHGASAIRAESASDDQGRFTLAGVPVDFFTLWVAKKGFMAAEAVPVAADDQDVTVALAPPLRLRGAVVDAETGEPIPTVRVTPGIAGEHVYWYRDDAEAFRDGRYEVAYEWPNPASRVFKFEADGYLTVVSPAFDSTKGGDHTFDVKLAKGEPPTRPAIAGVVLKPDGTPAAGATVHVATKTHPIYVRNGQDDGRREHPKATAAADGSFRFPPMEEAGMVMVLDDAGYASMTDSQMVESGELRLVAWGRVEGEVRSGAGVVPNGSVTFMKRGRDFAEHRMATFDTQARADAQGRFAFDRAYPGEGEVQRMIQVGPTMFSGQSGPSVTVRPGETTRVVVGGGGRTVKARAVVPEGTKLAVDWTRTWSNLRFQPPPIPIPPGLDAPGRKAWLAIWEASPEGQARAIMQRERGFYAVAVAADGAIRIEDVRPGTYTLTIQPHSTNGQGKPIGLAQAVVVVPEIADGDLAKPLEIGDVELKAADQ